MAEYSNPIWVGVTAYECFGTSQLICPKSFLLLISVIPTIPLPSAPHTLAQISTLSIFLIDSYIVATRLRAVSILLPRIELEASIDITNAIPLVIFLFTLQLFKLLPRIRASTYDSTSTSSPSLSIKSFFCIFIFLNILDNPLAIFISGITLPFTLSTNLTRLGNGSLGISPLNESNISPTTLSPSNLPCSKISSLDSSVSSSGCNSSSGTSRSVSPLDFLLFCRKSSCSWLISRLLSLDSPSLITWAKLWLFSLSLRYLSKYGLRVTITLNAPNLSVSTTSSNAFA